MKHLKGITHKPLLQDFISPRFILHYNNVPNMKRMLESLKKTKKKKSELVKKIVPGISLLFTIIENLITRRTRSINLSISSQTT